MQTMKGTTHLRPFSGAKTSETFGVEAEIVKEPGELKGAIARAQRAIADGRPPGPVGAALSKAPRAEQDGLFAPRF